MSNPSRNKRGKFVRIISLLSALIAGFLISALPLLSSMNMVEWTNFTLLLIVVLGSATLAFAPSRAEHLARASARVLWVLGVVMFIRHIAGASGFAWTDAGPALVVSHALVVSLWISVITSATLVLWRDHAGRTRAR
jgi:hypothetical protein